MIAPVWVRSQRAALVDLGGSVVVLGTDGTIRRLDGASADLARVVVDFIAVPRTRAEIVAHVESIAEPGAAPGAGPIAGADPKPVPSVIDQLLALLAETGAIVQPRATRIATAPAANIVVGISGAIAASHAAAFVIALQRRGHTVEVALTPTASRFVSIDALRAIVGREPHTSTWPRAAHEPVPHVALAHWADLVVVYPATATTIGRIANGDFSDVVAATALTTRAPVVIVPSMNAEMLAAPAVQRNLERLRDDGHAIVHGVPAEEAADAPSLREPRAGAAPSATEVASTIDALVAASLLRRPDRARDWDAAYRQLTMSPGTLACDPDISGALARHAPPPRRLLDIGCGLGQVARHAARAGYRVVAIDVSRVALELAAKAPDDANPIDGPAAGIVWLHDDICASNLAGPFEVVVDRASLHVLPERRWRAWAQSIRRLATDVVIVKAHRDKTATTTGWSARAIAALLADFEVIADEPATLPHPHEPTAIPAVLVVLRRSLTKYEPRPQS